jgi:hypothetical protein
VMEMQQQEQVAGGMYHPSICHSNYGTDNRGTLWKTTMIVLHV